VTPPSGGDRADPEDRTGRPERSTIGVVSGLRGILVVAVASAALAGVAWVLALGLALMFDASP
jgi:hypothetical protein